MVLRILNLEGHQNCIIGSKVRRFLKRFLSMINYGFFFGSEPSLVCILGESAGECLWLLAKKVVKISAPGLKSYFRNIPCIKCLMKHFVLSTILDTASTKTNVWINMQKLFVKTNNVSGNIATRGMTLSLTLIKIWKIKNSYCKQNH